MVQVRYFDAFPKKENSRALPEISPTSVAACIIMLLILWVETTGFMGAHQDYQFSVDKSTFDTVQVNLDVTVATPCVHLQVGVIDVAGDQLFINRDLDFRPLRGDDELASMSIGSGWSSSFGYHQFEPEEEWCRISGIFKTNRVKSQIFISAAQWQRRSPRAAAVNMSHGINELSFGAYYPSLQNPLDETALVAGSLNSIHTYDLTIVPTTVKGFGIEMETNQYTVSEGRERPEYLPGIYMIFDFEPISLILIDGRMSFFQWLYRVANIVGGIAFAYSWYRRRKAEQDYDEEREEMNEKV